MGAKEHLEKTSEIARNIGYEDIKMAKYKKGKTEIEEQNTISTFTFVPFIFNSPDTSISYNQKGIYTPFIFSIFSSLLKNFGINGLPLLRDLKALTASSLVFLNGIT